MGLLSYFGVPQDSLLGNIGQTLSDNSGLLMGYGAGGAEGMMRGSLMDDQRKAKVQEKIALKAGLMQLGLDEAKAEAMAQSPTSANMYLQKLQNDRAQANADRSFGLQKDQFDFTKQQAVAKQKPTYGVVGKDEFGNETYGWIDPYSQSITPNVPQQQSQGFPLPQGADTSQVIPPAPPGVNPKIWRDKQTEALANQGKPTTDMQNKLAAAEKSAADLKSSLERYKTLVGTYGVESWNGEGKSRLNTAYTDVLIKMKEAANLGVLNGPDLELMQKQLEEASVSGLARLNPFKQWGIEGRVGAQVGEIAGEKPDEIGGIIGRGLETARKSYGGQQSGPRGAAIDLGNGVKMRRVR